MKTLFVLVLLLICLPALAQSRFTRYVTNVTDLVAINPNGNDRLYTLLSRDVLGDDGGGDLYWTPGSTATTNLGTVFASTWPGATGRFIRLFSGAYNVGWFGARGDGSDQTVQIKAAYDTIPKNEGGDLFFPPGNYAFNLTITNRNIGLIFESFIKEDSGSPVIVSNIITAADISRPIVTVGDGVNSAKGTRIVGGTFIGNGSAGVLLRLAGGAYECEIDGSQFYNARTNIWIQGNGSQPCSINRFSNGSCLAANVVNSRGFYAAQPDAGTSYTTGTSLSGYHFNSQLGVAGGNTYIMEIDATQISLTDTYLDILTNCPILFSQSAGVNIQQPIIKAANVTFDAGSVIPVVVETWGASPRISAVLQGGYSYDGTFIAGGTTITSEKNQSPVAPGGQFAAPNMNGRVSFDRIGGTTNRYWNTIEANDSDPTIFQLSATNGTMEILGRTNVTIAAGGLAATNKLVYVQPAVVSITNASTGVTPFRVFGAGSGIYSDTNAPTMRIHTAVETNQVKTALHLDSYNNTPAFPISLDFGLDDAAQGAFTSRIVHYGNVNTNRETELQLWTHSITNGVWNTNIVMNHDGVGISAHEAIIPAAVLDINGDIQIRGTNLNIRAVQYAFPAAQGAASTVLQNDGAGNLTWAPASGGGATNAYNQVQWDTTNITQQTTIRFQGGAVSNIVDSGGVTIVTLKDDGGGSGTTINPTDLYLPYRSNSTTFADSPLFVATSSLIESTASIELTNSMVFISTVGSEASPSYTFNGFGNVGMFLDGTGALGLGHAGVQQVQLSNNAFNVSSNMVFGFSTDPGTAAPLIFWRVGNGSPEGAITSRPGGMFLRLDGSTGTTLYIKETGTGNTGWVAFSGGAGSGDITSVGDVASGAAFDGTQGTILTFNNGGGDGTFSYDGTSFIVTHPLDLGSAGVRLSGDGDGAITFLGLGNGADENLILNLDDTANEAVFSSGTGVTNVNLSANTLSLSVPNFAYDSTAWNGLQTVPTRDDIRDIVQSLGLINTNGLLGFQQVGAGTDFPLTNDFSQVVFGSGGSSFVLTNAGTYQIVYTVGAFANNTDDQHYFLTNVTDGVLLTGSAQTIPVSSSLTPLVLAVQYTTTGANKTIQLFGMTDDATYTGSPNVLATNTVVDVIYLGNPSGGGSSDNWVASGTTNSTLPGVGFVHGFSVTNFLQLPVGASPTTDAFGEIAGDNDAWAASRGAPQFFDGTANTYLVNVLSSDTPSDGQFPRWNTGGTITWETVSGASDNWVASGTTNSTLPGSLFAHNGTLTNTLTLIGNSAASAPIETLTGTWFTGGSATTTKPHFLIEPTGAGSTAWSTSGTGLGVNAASGFTGNLADFQLNGTSNFRVSSAGALTIASTFITSGTIQAGSGSFIQWNARSALSSPSNGSLQIANSAGTGFTELQLGPDDATPDAAVTIQAASGVGTDIAGGSIILAGGARTGTGAGGNVRVQTTPSATSTGTGAGTLIDRTVWVAKGKVLTDASAVSLFEIALPTLKMCGGKIEATIQCTDGTDMQAFSQTIEFSAVNKGGVYTKSITANTGDKSVSGGSTLTTTWTLLDGADKLTVQLNADTSLTPSSNSFVVYYRITNNSEQAITVL